MLDLIMVVGLMLFLHKGVNYEIFLIDSKVIYLLIYASKGDYGCVWSDFIKRGIEGHM